MGRRSTTVLLAVVATVAILATTAGAAVIGVYRNGMGSDSLRGQIAKLSGERCARGGSAQALRVVIGKSTAECSYRTPVIGRDLEVAVTGRLLAQTPVPAQRKAFLALDLRAGDAGARYQLAAFPLQRKAQLLKVTAEGQVKYLHVEKDVRTKGINQANQLRLRAFNVTSGPEKGACRILAFVGQQLVADVTDSAAGELEGRFSGFSLGALGNAKGAAASFDDLVIRIPSPF